MTALPQLTLILYSHGRNPPLNPPPDLKYDLRSIPNPPKALRQVSYGRSKRIREHLLSEPKFVQKLEEAEQDILQSMRIKIAEYDNQLKEYKVSDRECEDTQPPPEAGQAPASEYSSQAELEEVSEVKAPEHEILLRVGCNCALGHHRSVAFVECLSTRPWPKEWQVHVVHRDLEKKRAGGARQAQKAGFREKRSHERDTWE